MIIVDSSIWIDFFSGKSNATAAKLHSILESSEEVYALDLIVAEVLIGIRDDRQFLTTKSFFDDVPRFEVQAQAVTDAVNLYRELRKQGITPRGLIDCIIASVALDAGASVFTLDKDFEPFKRFRALQLVEL